MDTKVRIFTETSVGAIQVAVNDFIGTQTVDGNTVNRKLRRSHFIEVGGTFYMVIFYDE